MNSPALLRSMIDVHDRIGSSVVALMAEVPP